jgi:hypothetical protein
MNTFTEYADDYLAGYNSVPVGVLDNPEFQAEVRRLAGGPTKEEQIKYLKQTADRLGRVLKPLYGPRGGLAREHRSLEFQYHQLLGELETLSAETE